MSAVRVIATPSVSSFARTEWDALAGESFHVSWGWLRSQEGAADTVSLILACQLEDELVAAAPTLGVGADQTVIVGGRTGYQNQLLLSRHLSPEQQRAAVGELCQSVNAHADQLGGWQAAWPYLSAADAEILLSLGNATLHFDGAAVVLPGWDSDVSSSRRRTMAHEVSVFALSDWRVAHSQFQSEDVNEIASLLAQNINKYYGHANEDGIRAFLQRQAQFASGNCILLRLLDRQNRMQGFSMLFKWRKTLYGRVVGFNYAVLRGSFEYFNLAFYQPFDIVNQLGLNAYHMGTGAYEAKVSRGGRLVPLWRVVTNAVDPEASRRAVLQAATFAAEWTARKPSSISSAQWRSPL